MIAILSREISAPVEQKSITRTFTIWRIYDYV